ncbi:low-density lipoprotein receptor-related protein 6-like isoform X1 [Gigantopelta aegis]|uniref:low-density lipoprotein receptor-related protein 6-like isoform X1 n=1 Tax=Gigantopelta aegis TaxID=1735272 RepID=UPI001B88A5C1|nr:low-density lipoprotein receptor-related protein 6-like isoform X1 [Gigantopelta aegis]
MKIIYQLTVEVLFVLSIAFGKRSGDVYVLFTDSSAKEIWKLDVSNSSYSNIGIENHENPIAIDYDPVMNKIYWTDVGGPDIRTCGFNGEDLRLVRTLKPDLQPYGLTLDPVSRLIFYTDTGNDVIALMDMTDYYHKTIINTNLDEPRGIALDRTQRMMYWTDRGASPKIERATYSGESRTTLVSAGLGWPNGITLDTQGQKMYWCDAKTQVIEVMNFDGYNRRRMVHGERFQPFDVFLFEQIIYTTEWNRTRIYHIYLDGRNVTSWDGRRFKRLNGIHVFRAGAFQNDTNACTTDKGGCEQICIPTSGGRQCACDDGYTLTTNGLNCTDVGRSETPSFPISIPIVGAAASGVVVVIVIIIIVVVVVVKRRRTKKSDSDYDELNRNQPVANREPVFNIAYGLDDDSRNDSPQRPTCTNEGDVHGPYSKLGAAGAQPQEEVYDVIGPEHFGSPTDLDYIHPFHYYTGK